MLERDRPWSAYAIGDLSPGFAQDCEWRIPEGGDALVLVYRGFHPPILFGLGSPERLGEVIREVDAPEISLQIRREALPALAPHFEVIEARSMWRMVLDPMGFRPGDVDGVEPLDAADIDDIVRLYKDGSARGEAPDFFFPSMVEQGVFRGFRDGADLVAVAGTHLLAPDLGVCAIGNVYTRLDRRGRGLAARVTSAVVAAAFARNVGTVVLNVRHHNDTARRVYERLGFRRHCDFVEGRARAAAGRESPIP
jgi:ribosomal protein S18 acetylase RimI-like enzyme